MPPGERRGNNLNRSAPIDKTPENGIVRLPTQRTEAFMQRTNGIEFGRYVGEGRDGIISEVKGEQDLVVKWWKPTFDQTARRNEVGLHQRVMKEAPDLVPRFIDEVYEGQVLRGFVMGHLVGIPLGDILIKHRATPDPSFVFDLQTILARVWDTCRVSHGDPHPWNFLIDVPQIEIDEDTRRPVLYGAERIWLIDFSRSTMTVAQHQMDMRAVAARLRGFGGAHPTPEVMGRHPH